MLTHFTADIAGVRRPQNVVPQMQRAKDAGCDSRNEDEQKSDREFPLQGVVQCENSVWIAVSAIAYSFVCGKVNALSSRNC